jgi:hypothetical protein
MARKRFPRNIIAGGWCRDELQAEVGDVELLVPPCRTGAALSCWPNAHEVVAGEGLDLAVEVPGRHWAMKRFFDWT